MDQYPEPLSVGIQVASDFGKTAWGLASNAGHFIAEVMPDGTTDVDAHLAAFGALVQREEFTGAPIDLYCASEALCQALATMSQTFPHITVHPWTKMVPRGLLVRTASRAAYNAIDDLTPHPLTAADGPVAPLVAATDGSAGFHGPKGSAAVTGWAWITNTGTHSHGTFESGSILAAEIYAISQVLAATSRDVPLTILTDSADALTVINDLRAGASPVSFTFPGSAKTIPVLRRIRTLLKDRDVTITWVRGHSGNPLNEAADRLAVHARRAAQMQASASVSADVVRRIVAETMDNLTTVPSSAPMAA